MIPALSPTFDAALRDVQARDARFRRAAAERLAVAPLPHREAAISGLIALADDADAWVRQTALESLGELSALEALDTVLSGIKDAHGGARQAAVLAATRIAPEASKPAVVALLGDSRSEMRFAAIWALSRAGEDAAADIASGLTDVDPHVRALTAQCLGEIGADVHIETLAGLLQDPSEDVRFAAACALAALKDSRGADLLRDALRSTDRAYEAAIALGDLRDHPSRAALTQLAQRRFGSPTVRAAAARALVRLGEPTGVDALRRILRSWRIEGRQYAIELVTELGLTSLLPDVARALRRNGNKEEAQQLLASLARSKHTA